MANPGYPKITHHFPCTELPLIKLLKDLTHQKHWINKYMMPNLDLSQHLLLFVTEFFMVLCCLGSLHNPEGNGYCE